MFRAELIGSEEMSWEELFAGYVALKAITFSSSVEMLLRLADRLADMEVVFGSEIDSVRRSIWRSHRRVRPSRAMGSAMR